MKTSAKLALLLVLALLCFMLPAFTAAEGQDSHGGENPAEEQYPPGERNPPEEKIREELETELKHLSEQTDFYEWQPYFDEIPELTGIENEYNNIGEFVESIALSAGEAKSGKITESLKTLLVPSFIRSLKRLTGIVAIAVLTGFCGIAAGKGKSKLTEMLMLFLCASAVLALTAMFSDITADTLNAIRRAERFTAVTEPILTGLLSALGCMGSVKLLSPALVFLSGGIMAFVKTLVMPTLLAAGVLTVTDGLSDKIKFSNTVKLLRKAVKWLLGLAATVYIALTAIGGISAGISDGVSIRTAKYAVDRLVPAVGGMVTGAVDAAIGGALLLKNAAGIVSIILLAVLVLKPLAELFCAMLAFRAAAAVTEPFSDERITKMLDGTAENVSLLFAALAAVTSMFVITVVIIISAGGTLAG